MGLDSPIHLTKMDENRNKENRVEMQIADSNLVIQAETMKKRMDRNPKTPLEEIFEDDYLTRLGIGVAVAVYWSPSYKIPVVKHAQFDEVVDGRFGGFRLPPFLPHHFGSFRRLCLGHLLPLSPLCSGFDGVQRARRS
jgi:hypothetical protein